MSATFSFTEEPEYFSQKVSLFMTTGPTLLFKDTDIIMKIICRFGVFMQLFHDIGLFDEYINRMTPILYWGRKLYVPYSWPCSYVPGACALKEA